MKKMISPAISKVKKRLIRTQITQRRATRPERADAESGKRGDVGFMSGGSQGPGLGALPPTQEHDEKGEADGEQGGGSAHEVQGDGAVAADRRVVVETVEQDLVDEAADPVARGLDQPQP